MSVFDQTKEKLISFASLPSGWNFGEGIPTQELPLKQALAILEVLDKSGFHHTDAYPGVNGDVLLSAYALPDYYDFKVKLDGSVTVAHMHDEEEKLYQEAMPLVEVFGKIKEFASQKWPTSDYSTSAFITARS